MDSVAADLVTTFRVVMLIQAHKDVALLNRLIDRLIHPQVSVYVSLDLKSDIVVEEIDPRARLIARRVSVHWADFSQVQATLTALQEIHAREPSFDYLSFISGQDYPVKPMETYVEFLRQRQGAEFMTHGVIQDGTHFADRYQLFHRPADSILPEWVFKLSRSVMKRLGCRRHMPGGMRAHVGSCWFALTRPCIDYLLSQARQPDYLRFMSYTRYSDEMFLQTLVVCSPYADKLDPEIHRYIHFQEHSANASVLTEADLPAIEACGAMFCRKVDSVISARLLDLLDVELQQGGGGR